MSDYIKVSLVLVGDTIEYIVHASGTNTVEVLAHLDQSEIDTKIEQLKKIANVKDVVVGEKHRVVQRSAIESVGNIQDSVSASRHVKRSTVEPQINVSDSVSSIVTRFRQSSSVTIEERLYNGIPSLQLSADRTSRIVINNNIVNIISEDKSFSQNLSPDNILKKIREIVQNSSVNSKEDQWFIQTLTKILTNKEVSIWTRLKLTFARKKWVLTLATPFILKFIEWLEENVKGSP